jgi:hypothetical protein
MKLRSQLEAWGLSSLRINVGFLETEWQPREGDREAAWELYVEMLTRIVTQPLDEETGDLKSALTSVHALFPLTRDVLKRRGRDCVEFTKIAVVVLNQVVRPFTARWHALAQTDALSDPNMQRKFRAELAALQGILRNYTRALADIAQVEDMTSLAATGPSPTTA